MKCLTCKTEIKSLKENEWFPFCCERCKMVDLYNWLNEEYVISEPLPDVSENTEELEKFWVNK